MLMKLIKIEERVIKMENNKNTLNKQMVNKWFIIPIIVSSIIGPGALRLPNVLIPHFKQSIWIGTILGGFYPFLTLLICLYIIKNLTYEDFFQVSKDFFGNALGTFLYFIFISQWFLYFSTICNDFIIILRTYIVSHLTSNQVMILLILVSGISTSFGLKGLTKGMYLINILFFSVLILAAHALPSGSKSNLMPLFDFDYSFTNLSEGILKCLYYYTGFELLIIFAPFAKSYKDLKWGAYMGLIICILIWTWIGFITIYYIGIDVTKKTFYSVVYVYESIRLPIVNSTRHITMFCWTLIVCRLLSMYYYVVASSLNKVIKVTFNELCFILMPIAFLLTKISANDFMKNLITIKLPIIYVLFNFLYLLALSFLIKKSKSRGNNNENT